MRMCGGFESTDRSTRIYNRSTRIYKVTAECTGTCAEWQHRGCHVLFQGPGCRNERVYAKALQEEEGGCHTHISHNGVRRAQRQEALCPASPVYTLPLTLGPIPIRLGQDFVRLWGGMMGIGDFQLHIYYAIVRITSYLLIAATEYDYLTLCHSNKSCMFNIIIFRRRQHKWDTRVADGEFVCQGMPNGVNFC